MLLVSSLFVVIAVDVSDVFFAISVIALPCSGDVVGVGSGAFVGGLIFVVVLTLALGLCSTGSTTEVAKGLAALRKGLLDDGEAVADFVALGFCVIVVAPVDLDPDADTFFVLLGCLLISPGSCDVDAG